MKKLQLNKETIARLNNPERIMGGEKYSFANTVPNSRCEICVPTLPNSQNCPPDTIFTCTMTETFTCPDVETRSACV